MVWLGLVLALLVLIVLAASWRFSNIALYPKTRAIDNSFAYMVEREQLDADAFRALPKEELRIRSPHGYDLFGIYIPVPGSRRTVIVAHGITATLYHSVKYMHPFRDRGYNVLLIEHRNHGRSGGRNTTYGFYEKDDLRAWIDLLQARWGEDLLIGLHGESMGAAIVLQTAALDDRIAFVVADCPFASAREEFAYRLKVEYGLPPFPLIPVSSAITKRRTGFGYSDAAPIDHMPSLRTPVFFIHGAEDTYIPPEASRRLYEAKTGYRKLWIVPAAEHAMSQPDNPEAYDRMIGEFLGELDGERPSSVGPEGDDPLL